MRPESGDLFKLFFFISEKKKGLFSRFKTAVFSSPGSEPKSPTSPTEAGEDVAAQQAKKSSKSSKEEKKKNKKEKKSHNKKENEAEQKVESPDPNASQLNTSGMLNSPAV